MGLQELSLVKRNALAKDSKPVSAHSSDNFWRRVASSWLCAALLSLFGRFGVSTSTIISEAPGHEMMRVAALTSTSAEVAFSQPRRRTRISACLPLVLVGG